MTDICLLDFESGGSGRGISYYTEAMKCPKRAQLNAERRERAKGKEHNYEVMYHADVGTVFHKLAELHHTKTDATVEIADSAADKALAEGQRAFAAYTQRFGPDFWGEVIGAEVHMPGVHSKSCPAQGGLELVCECGVAKRARQLSELFGVEFTGKIDLVVRMDEDTVRRVERDTDMEGLKPGLYLLDHKTKARKDSNMTVKFNNSLQFWAYMLAWNELNPDDPCLGMIANVVVRHKQMTEKSFSQLLCKVPTPDQEVVLGTFLNNSAILAKSGMPNAAVCFDQGICPHFESGRCGRQ